MKTVTPSHLLDTVREIAIELDLESALAKSFLQNDMCVLRHVGSALLADLTVLMMHGRQKLKMSNRKFHAHDNLTLDADIVRNVG